MNFTSFSNEERFIALESKQVDLLAAGATYTMERDLFEVRLAADVRMLFSQIDFVKLTCFLIFCAANGQRRLYVQCSIPL